MFGKYIIWVKKKDEISKFTLVIKYNQADNVKLRQKIRTKPKAFINFSKWKIKTYRLQRLI